MSIDEATGVNEPEETDQQEEQLDETLRDLGRCARATASCLYDVVDKWHSIENSEEARNYAAVLLDIARATILLKRQQGGR